MGIWYAFAQAITWAGVTIALRRLTAQLPALLINGIRAALALLILVPLVFVTGGWGDFGLLTPLRLVYLIGSVLVGGLVGDVFYLTSLRLIGVGRAFPISNSYPFFTMLFSALLLGTAVTWKMAAGMMLVLAGVFMVARPNVAAQPGATPDVSTTDLVKGGLCALAGAALWGFATIVLAQGLSDGINSVVATLVRVVAVATFSLLISLPRGLVGDLRRTTRRTWGLLLIAGVFGWGLGGSLYAAAVQHAGPSLAALIGATSPIFAMPLSWALLKERPTRYTLAGTLVTIVGIALVV
ncbi:MAG: DMT family transporter [Chloroflexota bacterium]